MIKIGTRWLVGGEEREEVKREEGVAAFSSYFFTQISQILDKKRRTRERERGQRGGSNED